MGTTDDLFSQLTPEQLSALLQGSTLQDKGTLLQQQLEDLLAGGMQHQEHSTPLGAGLGGLAEALDGTANAFHAKALRGQQQSNLDAQGKLMGDFGQLLRGPQQAPAPGPTQGTEVTPQWGMDLSGVPTSAPTSQTEISPQWGLDLTANQPADPTQIVDDGSDGWGLDLSAPGHAEALAAALRGKEAPAKVAAASSIHPGLRARRAPGLDDEQFSPFSY